tara:strand:- start:2729 stop:3367 length:639 start_codon:yes stop_codon:yes gene_type:complete
VKGLLFMKRTKEEAENTRDDLLLSAIQIFSEKGVARATLAEIAKGAGVTRGAVYWHFENKAQIFDALHERMYRPFLDGILKGLEKEHPNPLEQLRDLWIELFIDLEKDERRKQALTLFMRKCNYSGDLAPYKEEHQKKQEQSIKAFEDYLEKYKNNGNLPRGVDSKTLTEGMFCYMKGILFQYLDEPETYNIQKKAPQLIGLFFNSLISNKG